MKNDRIMPFLWIKNESNEEIGKELKAMLDMGISAFVVESRVDPEFCKEAWFRKMDFIMDFARTHDMKVWLLDDISYPTGVANGALHEKGIGNQARRIKTLRTDLRGKKSDIRVRVELNSEANEKLLAVYLTERGKDYYQLQNPIDVTDKVQGDYLYLDLEEGYYSVVCVIETSGHSERGPFIDMVNPNSVMELIDAVYEPHYKRYKDDFGETFCGFFSDEPRFNCCEYNAHLISNAYDGKIGKYGMAYPWSQEIQEKLGLDSSILSLWFDIGEKTADTRCRYMELLTDCYARYFVGQLSAWCRERGVAYTGHIIEDMDAHTSVMCSAAHFFKAMKGADLASVDVVLHQIHSTENDLCFAAPIASPYSDSEFFNYTLMKLASSCAHIDSLKKGRALCEIFGAYGWGESMSEMLYLANHCLVRGINYFIPHAFTSEFNNPDCPPHFYAGGLNPSNNSYKLLFDYMRNIAEIFSDGKPIIDVAVLYHAQTEWSGGDFDACDVVAKELMQNQIDFDFVDFEALSCAKIENAGLAIADNTYKILIVPYFEKLPEEYRELLGRYESHVMYAQKGANNVGDSVKKRLGFHYSSVPNLRVLRYEKNQKYYVMFFNEGAHTCSIRPQDFCVGFECGIYANDYISGTYLSTDTGEMPLRPLQAVICENEKHGFDASVREGQILLPSADVYLKKYDEDVFRFYKQVDNPFFNINRYDECPDFAGHVKIKPSMNCANLQRLVVEYDAEFCDLHIGDTVYQSIGGQLYYEFSDTDRQAEEIYFVLGSGLGNVLKDDLSKYYYLSPCKLISISVTEWQLGGVV